MLCFFGYIVTVKDVFVEQTYPDSIADLGV